MPLSPQVAFDFHLRNEFSFENFICAETNHELLTLLSARQIKNNFYFIWGNAGSGKSHLLQACCAMHENSVYLPLAGYSQYGESILDNLEQLELVCIDDVQQVVSIPAWEEKLFSLFNACQQAETSLIVISQQAPTVLEYALPDLQSRFRSGMTYQLHELSEAEKLQALKRRAEFFGMPLEDEVLNFICTRAQRGTHQLFQVLEKLERVSLNEKRKLTIPFVKSLMQW